MAYVPMTAGGGGSIIETTLWTNNAPTSSFALQAVTLSDNISNYDYIVIEYRASTANDARFKVYFKSTDLDDYTSGNNCAMMGLYSSNSYFYYRIVRYDNDTTITFGSCYRNTAGGTSSSNNGADIPLTIKGIKLQNVTLPS